MPIQCSPITTIFLHSFLAENRVVAHSLEDFLEIRVEEVVSCLDKLLLVADSPS